MASDDLGGPLNTALAVALAAGRVAIGASIWAAPGPAMRALGFDPGDDAALILGRLAGTRDVATGGLALAALGDREATRRMALVNAGIDAGDALAFGAALGRGRDRAALLGVAVAVSGTAAGVRLAARLGARTQES